LSVSSVASLIRLGVPLLDEYLEFVAAPGSSDFGRRVATYASEQSHLSGEGQCVYVVSGGEIGA
jgi:hypothetical protein